MSVERINPPIDNRQLYPGEIDTAIGATAFSVLRHRYDTAERTTGSAHFGALTRTASITITRSTLASSSIGTSPVNLTSAWPKVRSNRWVFDLFSHERVADGKDVLVPAQVAYGTIGGFTVEGDDLPEGDLNLDPSRIPTRMAGVWVKVTNETFEDYSGFDSWANTELTRQLLSVIDDQLLNGNGINPSLNGLLNNSNIQSQSKGADTLTVAISKAFAKILNVGFAPNAIIVSPDDFGTLMAPDPIGFSGTFFGVPLIASDHIANSLPLVGDFTGATVFERSALTFQMTNADSDDFLMNIRTIKAFQQLALAVFAPKAFCKVVA